MSLKIAVFQRRSLQHNKKTSVVLKSSGNPSSAAHQNKRVDSSSSFNSSSHKQWDRYADELWTMSEFKQVGL